MPKGWPDFTVPITIEAVTIETLPIDIKTQTAETIAVDITAQTAAVLNVNITAGITNVRAGKAAVINPDFEEGTVGWVLYGTAEITDEENVNGDFSLKLYPGTYDYALQAGMSPPIDTNKIVSFTVYVLTKDYPDDVRIYLTYTDGTYTMTTCQPSEADSWELFNINYDADKLISALWVREWGTNTGVAYVDTLGLQLKIDEYVGTATGVNLNVDIKAQTVTLNVAIQSSAVTLNVNLESQTVDINIKTSGGVNLVIDKLTQTAYVEDRRTLSNNGETAGWGWATGDTRQAKFFPRGCRGFLATVPVYCKDAGAAGGTITVYISPHPSMGYIASADVTVPAEGSATWRSATFNRMWNYDSLFIFVLSSSVDIQYGLDTGSPYDGYNSTDAGVTWVAYDWRLWIRAVMKAMTVGDLPVSGTLNTITIPHASDTRLYVSGTVGTATTSVKTIDGAGVVQQLLFRFDAADASHTSDILLYCDGKLVFFWGINLLNTAGYTATTPCIQLLKYAENGFCSVQIDIKFEFQRHFEIKINAGAADTGYKVEGVVNLIK